MAEKAYEEKRALFESMQSEIDTIKNQKSVEEVIHTQRAADYEQRLRDLEFSYSAKLERLDHFE